MQPSPVQNLHPLSVYSNYSDVSALKCVFENYGTKVCVFGPYHLECLIKDGSGWRPLYTWIPGRNANITHQRQGCVDVSAENRQWRITNALFFDVSSGRQGESTISNHDSLLLVGLIDDARDWSLIAYLSPASASRGIAVCSAAFYLRGVVTCLERVSALNLIGSSQPAASTTTSMMDTKPTLSATMDLSACENKAPLAVDFIDAVTCFSGCLAVGFRQGQVALVDLCLDWPRAATGLRPVESSSAIEKSQLFSLAAQNERISVLDTDLDHVFVYLDNSVTRWNEFHYNSINGRLLHTFPVNSVYISALRFIGNTQSLVVGFSFGGWQIWSLNSLKLEFCLRSLDIVSPVVEIAFLEPSDDPRYCCYLWIGWQSLQEQRQQELVADSSDTHDHRAKSTPVTTSKRHKFTEPHLKLYQLCYERRVEASVAATKESNYRYQRLIGLSERMTTSLTFTNGPIGEAFTSGRLIGLQPLQPLLPPAHTGQQHQASHSEENDSRLDSNASSSGSSTVLSTVSHLVAFVWRASAGHVRVGLFDLDRWYHAQMPTNIRVDNSFFTTFDVPLSTRTSSSMVCLKAHLLADSLTSFWSQLSERETRLVNLCPQVKVTPTVLRPVPEVYLRPSALAFSLLVVVVGRQSALGYPSRWGGGLQLMQFVSRQEACLSNVCKATAGGVKAFDLVEWISEAWVTGLLESPGLDPLDEDDLIGLLQQEEELVGGAPSEAGDRLAFGLAEDGQAGLLVAVSQFEEMTTLAPPPSALLTPEQTPLPKRRRLTAIESGGHQAKRKTSESRESGSLRPAWVLLMNCLLEHGCLTALKSIGQLARGHSGHAWLPCHSTVRRRWLWLRFCRLKARFDRLTGPLFTDAVAGSLQSPTSAVGCETANRLPDPQEFGTIVHQLHQMKSLAKTWSVHGQPQTKSDWLLHSIATYSTYTRVVALLWRLGLLPQEWNSQSECVGKRREAILLPYNQKTFRHVINRLRGTPASEPDGNMASNSPTHEPLIHLPLTEALIARAAGYDKKGQKEAAVAAGWHIWLEQEQANCCQSADSRSHNRSAVPLTTTTVVGCYPPARIQSVCSLIQLPNSGGSGLLVRLAVVGFLLCDATAVTAFSEALNESGVSESTAAGVSQRTAFMSALQLCRHVLQLFAQEFNMIRPLLPCIIKLWLLDRGRIQDALSPQLTDYITQICPSATCKADTRQLLLLLDLLSEQSVKKALLSSQSGSSFVDIDVGHQLTRCLLGVNSADQLTKQSDSSATVTPPEVQMSSAGAPFLCLSRLRHLVERLRKKEESDSRVVGGQRRLDQLFRETFVQLAENCKRAGRLGDLITLGLTPSEAEILFKHFDSTDQRAVLFHCLLARNQFKAALSLFCCSQLTADEYTDVLSTERRSEDPLTVLFASLLSTCLPPEPTAPHQTRCSTAAATQALAAVSGDLDISSLSSADDQLFRGDTADGGAFIAYRQHTAIRCPLTQMRTRSPFRSRPREMPSGGRQGDSRQLLQGSHLRRSPSEVEEGEEAFWDTFRELEDMKRGYSGDFNSLANSQAPTNTRSRLETPCFRSSASGRQRVDNDSTINQQLLKLVYTPPALSRSHLPRSPDPNASSHRNGWQPPPVSILKSPARTGICSVVGKTTGHQASSEDMLSLRVNQSHSRPDVPSLRVDQPQPRPGQSAFGHHINLTSSSLDEDGDVTLNLISIRPSSTGLNEMPLVGSSAALHAPASSSLSTTTSSPVDSGCPKDYIFAAPLKSPLATTGSVANTETRQKTAAATLTGLGAAFHFSAPVSARRRLEPDGQQQQIEITSTVTTGLDETAGTGSRNAQEQQQADTSNMEITLDSSDPLPASVADTEHPKSAANRTDWTLASDYPSLKSGDYQVNITSGTGRAGEEEEEEEEVSSLLSFCSSASTTTTTTVDETSSLNPEAPRRSGRRVRQPKRYDAADFRSHSTK